MVTLTAKRNLRVSLNKGLVYFVAENAYRLHFETSKGKIRGICSVLFNFYENMSKGFSLAEFSTQYK